MTQRASIPPFGNWKCEDDIPYTAYFDKERKGKIKDGGMINPNDTPNNHEVDPGVAKVHASPLRSKDDVKVPSGVAATIIKPKHQRRASGEDGDVRQIAHSPAHHETAGRSVVTDSSHHRHGERGINQRDPHRKVNRTSLGNERSIENSPLHPHYHRKTGMSSPSWERKVSSDSSNGLAPSTPARSRLKGARGDETPDKGAAVPKFGDWDEKNPESADGFTHIFNKVRQEKQTESAIPIMPTESSYHNRLNQDKTREESVRCWCFPWSKN